MYVPKLNNKVNRYTIKWLLTFVYLCVTFGRFVLVTVALLDAVCPEGKVRALDITGWTEVPRQAFAVSELLLAITGRTLFRTRLIAEVSKHSRRTSVFTVLTLYSGRAPAFSGHVITTAAILARADAVAVLAIWTLAMSDHVYCVLICI